jgi:RHS repeat-associated protein
MRPNVISPPTGPGSIDGLGASFQENLCMGTASYSIPLKCPPGRAGCSPNLTLQYDTGFGNGIFGLGWRVKLPCISRECVERLPFYTDYPIANGIDNDHDGVTNNYNEFDVFTYNCSEELVPTTDSGSWRLQHERDFMRFYFTSNVWTALDRNGGTLTFGSSPASRVEDDQDRIYTWCLDKTSDAHGNTIHYVYTNLDNTYMVYCSEIDYNEGGQMRVVFSYEPRPDILTDFRPRYELRTAYRCNGIQMYVGTTLVRSYACQYEPTTDSQPLSRLQSVTEVGRDGNTSLPPITFQYSGFSASNAQPVVMTNAPPVRFDNPNVQLIDLDGDSLPDIIDTTQNPHTFYLNMGPDSNSVVNWSGPQLMHSNINVSLSSQTTELADMQGKCRTALLDNSSLLTRIFTVDTNLEWQQLPNMQGAAPSLADPTVRLLDVNGDRLTDIMQTAGAYIYVWVNLNAQQWSAPYVVPSPNPSIQFSDPEVHLADMNGDKLVDLVYLSSGICYYYPAMGYGQFGPKVVMNNPPSNIADTTRLFLADVNGDGLADVIYIGGSSISIYLNLGLDPSAPTTGRFAPPIIIPSEYVNNFVAFRTANINGNGSIDLVLNAMVNGQPSLIYYDLAGNVRPNLLLTVMNGLGRTTSLTYRPFVIDAMIDKQAGTPWPNPVPINIPVVASVTTDDGEGPNVSEFQYHNGYYAASLAQWRGFGRSEQHEFGDSDVEDVVKDFIFDTGIANDALRGVLLGAGVGVGPDTASWPQYQGKGIDPAFMYSIESNAWDPRTVVASVPEDSRLVTFASRVNNTKIIYEKGAGSPVETTTDYDYDDFGNTILMDEIGTTNSTPVEQRITTSVYSASYASGISNWILNRLVSKTVEDGSGNLAAQTLNYYDSSSELGAVNLGDLTMAKSWVNGNYYATTVRKDYDKYGNTSRSYDPDYGKAPGHYRDYQYDPAFHTFPVAESIATGNGTVPSLTCSASYDVGLGAITNYVDFNGYATTFSYDSLGRINGIRKPPDAVNTVEYRYVLGFRTAGGQTVNWIETRSRDTNQACGYVVARIFYDGGGDQLMTKQQAEPATGSAVPQVVITGGVEYNSRKRPVVKLNPCYSLLSATTLEQLMAYEDIRSPTWQGLFHQNGALTALSLTNAPVTTLTYDGLLREIQIQDPDSAMRQEVFKPLIRASYDENATDPHSPFFNTPVIEYRDGLGRLIQVDEMNRLNDDGTASTDLHAWSTYYTYNANDLLTSAVDSQGNVKSMTYDGLNRMLSINDPDRGFETFAFDDAGNLLSSLDAKGQTLAYTYDGANRRLAESEGTNMQPSIVYHYDAASFGVPVGDGTTSTATNVIGRLAWVQDHSGEEHTSYDARGRVSYEIKRITDPQLTQIANGSATGSLVSYTTRYAYDSLDHLVTLVYPDNDEVGYAYNQRGLLASIVGGPNGNIISNVVYAPSGETVETDYGNGVRTVRSFDARLRQTEILTISSAAASNAELIHSVYTFDPASNIKSIQDMRPISEIPQGDPRRNNQVFAYDNLNRLVHAGYSFDGLGATNGNGGTINYTYDRIGNMLSQVSNITNVNSLSGLPSVNLGSMVSGGTAGRFNRMGRAATDPPGPHALTSIVRATAPTRVCTYDESGNVSTLDGLTNTWDSRNRLIAISNSQLRAFYVYDYTGRRIMKQVWTNCTNTAVSSSNATPVTVLYVNKYFEVRESDAPTKYVWADATRVASVTGSLSANQRIQRVRLWAGMNLVSVAVGGAIMPSDTGNVVSAYEWQQSAHSWLPSAPGAILATGSVLWVQVITNTTLTFTGTYAEPNGSTVPGGGTFVGVPGLETLIRTNLNSTMFSNEWHFDALNQFWQISIGAMAGIPPLPAVLSPGDVIFVRMDSATTLTPPDPTLRFRYYHQDHLGSASVISGEDGGLLEETAYFPFGRMRFKFQPSASSQPYGFAQDETDQESGFTYAGQRLFDAELGRFLNCDPAGLDIGQPLSPRNNSITRNPQRLNSYTYALNRPTTHLDADGEWAIFDNVIEGLVAAAVDVAANLAVDAVRHEPPQWGKIAASAAVAGVLGTLTSGLSAVSDVEKLQKLQEITTVTVATAVTSKSAGLVASDIATASGGNRETSDQVAKTAEFVANIPLGFANIPGAVDAGVGLAKEYASSGSEITGAMLTYAGNLIGNAAGLFENAGAVVTHAAKATESSFDQSAQNNNDSGSSDGVYQTSSGGNNQ